MFICEACEHTPFFDLDWYLVLNAGSGKIGQWYCSQCGERYDKAALRGTFGVIFRSPELKPHSFLVGVRIPDGRLGNFITFLKYINMIRTGMLAIREDALRHEIPYFLEDVRKSISE